MTETSRDIHPVAQRYLRRNFVLGIANGALWQLSETLMDPSLVMSWFLSQLTASNFIIGLTSPIRVGGWFLPQLLISGYVQHQKQKLGIYRKSTLIRCLALAVMSASVWLLGAGHPQWLLASVLLMMTIFALGGGVSGLVFLDIVAKTMPARRRGAYFAWRYFVGGILALGGGLVVRYVLDQDQLFPFPTGFALLFSLATVGISLASFAFGITKEPEEHADGEFVPFKAQLGRAFTLARKDPNFRRLIMTRILFILSGIATPFYIVYAKKILQAPVSTVGTYLMLINLAAIVSNPIWARLSAHHGNKLVILLSGLFGLAAPLSALVGASLSALSLFSITFVCQGIYQGSVMVGQVNFGLDIAPPENRPTYIGLINTILGIASLSLSLSGLLADLTSYQTLFWLGMLFAGSAILVARGLYDPRSSRRESKRQVAR
jgi:MFS family permease